MCVPAGTLNSSRQALAAGYWIAVCWYVLLAAVCAMGIVIHAWP
jgi:hypothetical protein